MNNTNRSERENCYAKVIFKESNTPGYVRDISSTGCRFDLLESVSWDIGEKKKVVIIPEEEVGFSPIHGTVEIRWIKKKDIYWSIGSLLISVKDEDSKKNYRLLLNYFNDMKKE